MASRRNVAGVAIALLALVAALALAGWPASTYADADFPQFWTAPRQLVTGPSPYAPPWGFPYPLWTILVLLPLAPLPFAVAAAAWLVGQLAALAIALGALVARVSASPRRDAFLLFGLAAAFEPLWLLAGGGNMTGFLVAAFAGALAAQLARRPFLAGMLLATVIVKPQAFLLAGPVLVLASPDRRRILAGAAAVAGPLVAASFLVRPGWLAEWQGAAVALQTSTGSNATLWTADRALGGGPVVVLGAVTALLAAFGAWALWRRPAYATLVAGALAVSVALAPHGWSYDHLLLLVPVAVTLAELGRTAYRLPLTAALLLALCLVPWALYGLALYVRASEDWSATVPVLVFAMLVLAERLAAGRTRRSVAAAPVLA